ncbi:MAG: aspartate aminotransferase family protein [Candidatus Aquicultorales bacterium]
MDEFIRFDEALSASQKEIREWWNKINPSHVFHFAAFDFDRRYVKAAGVRVWDDEGKEYLDFTGCYGALNLGHNHPKISRAVNDLMREEPKFLQATLNPFAGALAKNLTTLAPGDLDICFFCNSGAESVEAALKTARAATGRPAFVYTEDSFHGKTFGALSVTGREKYRKPFEPLLAECRQIPYGDASALDKALAGRDVAGFIVEPIQGEAGVRVPPEGYLKEAESLCKKYGTLLIVDEVQTGMGRTGRLFASEHEDVRPDIMTLAKSLGGGYIPLGCCMSRREVWSSVFGSLSTSLLHTTTLQHNAIACAAGLAGLETLLDEGLVEKAASNGEYFIEKLKILEGRHPMIKEVRGRGLMIGIEFYQPAAGLMDKLSAGLINKISHEFFAQMVMVELLKSHGIITLYTLNNPNVVRIQPPLMVERAELDRFVEALDEVCDRYKGFWGLTLRTGSSAIKSLFKR